MPWDYLLTIRMTLQPDFCKAVLTLKDASPATSMMHGDVLWKPAIDGSAKQLSIAWSQGKDPGLYVVTATETGNP